MGTVGHALRFAGRVYHQPAPFYSSTQQSILGEPDFLPESRRLLVEPRDGDDPIRLSAIFARGPAAVDYRHGADGSGASRENQVLARQRLVTDCHAEPDFSF